MTKEKGREEKCGGVFKEAGGKGRRRVGDERRTEDVGGTEGEGEETLTLRGLVSLW